MSTGWIDEPRPVGDLPGADDHWWCVGQCRQTGGACPDPKPTPWLVRIGRLVRGPR